MVADNNFINVYDMRYFAAQQELEQLRMEPHRDVWLMHPAIVNAWYSPNHNTISNIINIIMNSDHVILLQLSLLASCSPPSSREGGLAT